MPTASPTAHVTSVGLGETRGRQCPLYPEAGLLCNPASSWLTALPVQEHGFSLHKTAFQDALALRYGWMPSRTPSHCACGTNFSVDHALSCPKGGFPSIHHNEVRDITAELLSEVCHDVEVEPHLQPLSDERFQQKTANTQDGARLDIAMNGFWGGRYEKCYTDVRVFNPLAPSNSGTRERRGE